MPNTIFSDVNWQVVAEKAISAAVVLVLAFVCNRILRYFISRTAAKHDSANRRVNTISAIMRSVASSIVWIIAGFELIRIIFNVTPTSLIATAGVAGVAIGFGAQSMVKDFISGFFILFDDLIAVGEHITVGGFTGTVEELGLRSLKLRNLSGDLYTLQNGEVSKIINHSRGDRGVIVSIEISRDAPAEEAMNALKGICEKAAEQNPRLVEAPRILGVTSVTAGGNTFRVFCKTKAGEQFDAQWELLSMFEDGFSRAGNVKCTKIAVDNEAV